MTRQERHLWYDFLKQYPVVFRRQKQFGHYIVDFYCASVKLVVELDGSQHYEPEEKQVSYHLLVKSGMVVHLTQYFTPPKDQVVYSIEHGDDLMIAGHAPIEEFGTYLNQVLAEYMSKI